MTTIGGVAFRHLDRLPRVGDQVTVEGITITVLEMDEHRIHRVRASRGEGAEEAAIVDQVETGEAGEEVTSIAAIEPADEEYAAGTEDPFTASNEPDDAPAGGTRQKPQIKNDIAPAAAHAGNEAGHNDAQPDLEHKALH
jgi:hypothetical protein